MLPLHQRRVFSSGSRETRTHNGLTRTCFQDRLLIRPDDFHYKLRQQESNPRHDGSEPPARTSTGPTASIVAQLRGQESNLRTRGSKPRISTDRNYPAISRGTGGTRTRAMVLNRHPLCH